MDLGFATRRLNLMEAMNVSVNDVTTRIAAKANSSEVKEVIVNGWGENMKERFIWVEKASLRVCIGVVSWTLEKATND